MRQPKIFPNSLILVAFFFLGIASCKSTQVGETTLTPTESVNEPTSTIIPPTNTATKIPERKSTSTATPTFISASATPTPTESLVQITPLEPAQAEIVISELFQDETCDLPCWWTIIPGSTNWQEAHLLLGPIATKFSLLGEAIPPTGMAYFFFNSINWPDLAVGLTIKNSAVDSLSIERPNTPLSEILRDSGEPSEIWISTVRFSPNAGDNQVPFEVVLFYPELGFFTESVGIGTIVEGTITGCFAEVSKIRIWAVEEILSFDETEFGPNLNGPDRKILPLDEATNLTVSDFLIFFQENQTPICIETPQNIWLGPFGETPEP